MLHFSRIIPYFQKNGKKKENQFLRIFVKFCQCYIILGYFVGYIVGAMYSFPLYKIRVDSNAQVSSQIICAIIMKARSWELGENRFFDQNVDHCIESSYVGGAPAKKSLLMIPNPSDPHLHDSYHVWLLENYLFFQTSFLFMV